MRLVVINTFLKSETYWRLWHRWADLTLTGLERHEWEQSCAFERRYRERMDAMLAEREKLRKRLVAARTALEKRDPRDWNTKRIMRDAIQNICRPELVQSRLRHMLEVASDRGTYAHGDKEVDAAMAQTDWAKL